MKKFLLLILVAMTAFGVNAQTRKGEGSLMGSLGYQTNYERFGLQAQGRYVIANNLLFSERQSNGTGCECKLPLCVQFQ